MLVIFFYFILLFNLTTLFYYFIFLANDYVFLYYLTWYQPDMTDFNLILNFVLQIFATRLLIVKFCQLKYILIYFILLVRNNLKR